MRGVPASRILVAVSTAAIFAAPGTQLHAQQPGLTVEHAGADTITVAPGARGSIAFRIVNGGRSEVRAAASVEAPAGWRVASPTAEHRIPAGGSAIHVVSFYPADEAAGRYPLGLEVRAAGGPIAADLVHVDVPDRRRIEMRVEAAPDWATGGEQYEVLVRVMNTGNVGGRFGIAIHSPFGVDARPDADSIQLGVGESRVIRVEVMPPEEMSRAVMHTLRIRAIADTTVAEAVASVEILPGRRGAREPKIGLPASIRLRASQDARGGPPVRFQAAGPIRPGSATRITALLQGPSQSYSMFGEADVYRVGIQSPRFALDLGDNTFRLSQLTEPGQQGLGVGGVARLGPVSAGGFVQRDRRAFSPDTQYAAFATISPTRHTSMRANWLRTDSRKGREELVSTEASVRVPGWLLLQGEVGMRPATGASASSVELAAQRGPIALNVGLIEADTAYGGVHGGLSARSALLNVQPWRALYLEGSFQDQAVVRTLESGPFRSVQRSSRLAAGIGSAVAVEAQRVERTSSSVTAPIDHAASSVKLRFGVPLGPLTLHPTVERGVVEAAGGAESQPFWRAGSRMTLGVGPATLSSNVEYFEGGTLHRSADEAGVNGTATAAIRLGRTELRLSSYATRYLEPLRRDDVVLDAVVGHTLPFGHQLSARVMRRASDGLFRHDETVALLDYSIPLKIPTGGGQTGTIGIRLNDAETGDPLPRVILEIGGQRVVTDGRGRASVGALPPGVYYVSLDRSTTGPGRVLSVAMPLRVELEAGERRSIDLALLSAGGITVHASIRRAASASGRAGTSEPEPMERATVDFIMSDQRIRRRTDGSGTIDIRDLRPGRWTVKIASGDLPAFHRFDRDSVVVEVGPGGQSEVSFTGAPVRRQMEIVATADLVEQRAADRSVSDIPQAAAVAAAAAAAADSPELRVPAIALGEPAPAVAADRSTRRAQAGALGVPAPAREPTVATPAPPARITPPPTAREAPQGFTITVVAGDRSLRDIALLVYGDRSLWPRIFLANRAVVAHPDRLFAGLVLRIPAAGPLTAEEKAVARRYPETQQ